jgi:hypothetical protein
MRKVTTKEVGSQEYKNRALRRGFMFVREEVLEIRFCKNYPSPDFAKQFINKVLVMRVGLFGHALCET